MYAEQYRLLLQLDTVHNPDVQTTTTEQKRVIKVYRYRPSFFEVVRYAAVLS